jgi:hypothetical protein
LTIGGEKNILGEKCRKILKGKGPIMIAYRLYEFYQAKMFQEPSQSHTWLRKN